MGLIYVNPEGPGGKPDPLAAAQDIREAFMNDEETVALIAGGHTFGKAHGAADPSKFVGPEPEGASIAEMGLGWKNSFGSGNGKDTVTSGLEGAWTAQPATWDHGYFANLFGFDWELTKSPAGAQQWVPVEGQASDSVSDAHDPSLKHAPIMFTTDLALKLDPAYALISKRFFEDPPAFGAAFARAWFKLTHRDMGPHGRLVGALVPPPQIWQDPIPPPPRASAGAAARLSPAAVASLKGACLASAPPVSALVKCAWASASTYRCTDHRGGANGARLRLMPQKAWPVNDPAELATVLSALEKAKADFEATEGQAVSLADLAVLAGNAAVEAGAKAAGCGKCSLRRDGSAFCWGPQRRHGR
jgi:catalase-peroxidase